jgi:hypothetical protein
MAPLHVVWRAGLDLNPIDLERDGDLAWLEALIWPGEDTRLARFRAAVELARRDPPHLVKGGLAADLQPLIASAARSPTTVVLSSPMPRRRSAGGLLRRSTAPVLAG